MRRKKNEMHLPFMFRGRLLYFPRCGGRRMKMTHECDRCGHTLFYSTDSVDIPDIGDLWRCPRCGQEFIE
jgi:predicted nucleic-acid-binding Zn-ribbon protein